jgi:plasmid maintenance system antidote protein VapI
MNDTQQNWLEILKNQCAIHGQSHVARMLNVNNRTINLIIHGKYAAKNTKIKELVFLYFGQQPQKSLDSDFTHDNWVEILKAACEKFSRRKIANFLGVSHTTLAEIIKGKYPHTKTSVRIRVLSKIGRTVKDVDSLSLANINKQLSFSQELLYKIIDFVFCNPGVSEESLRLRFDEYGYSASRISLTLNTLVSQKFLTKTTVNNRDVENVHSLGGSRLIRFYNIACDCPTLGLGEKCADCRLGKLIISLDKQCGVNYDDE